MLAKDCNVGDNIKTLDGRGRLRVFTVYTKLDNGDLFVLLGKSPIGKSDGSMQLLSGNVEVERK